MDSWYEKMPEEQVIQERTREEGRETKMSSSLYAGVSKSVSYPGLTRSIYEVSLIQVEAVGRQISRTSTLFLSISLSLAFLLESNNSLPPTFTVFQT